MSIEPKLTSDKAKWIAPIESRKEKADYYYQTVLENQRDWYSAKAGTQKGRHLFFAVSVIVLGAVISCLQAIEAAAWVRYLTAALGASVSVFRAVDTLLHPGETWQGYRKASENMQREYRLYINNADVYADASDEEAAYRLLVERVETVLAEEQQLFWQFNSKNPVPQPTPKLESEAE
jgi:heat shock protein HspQ